VLQPKFRIVKKKNACMQMIFAGWRCSVETYVKIIEAMEKL
jgi:hypothetical protein